MENQTELNLSLADLTALRNIVDLACTRGAFRGGEMKTVGEVFERLDSFLNNVMAQAEANLANAGEDEAAVAESTQSESTPTGE